MLPDQFLVIAVDHPSLAGALELFLDELRSESRMTDRGSVRGRTPFPGLIDRLGAPEMMRLGVMHDRRLIAVAAVDDEGAVALAVATEFRRRGIADELVRVVAERAAAVGTPPLHRFTPHVTH